MKSSSFPYRSLLFLFASASIFVLTSLASGKTYPALLAVGDRSKIADVPRDKVIAFALYTVHKNKLKLTAQLYPLAKDESHKLFLDVKRDGAWKQIAETTVHPIGWSATFTVPQWDTRQDHSYRVRHALGSTFTGMIRKDPRHKRTIVVAAFTGNSPGPGGGKISKKDVVINVNKINPDILFFTGDQVYNHFQHTAHWIKFGETFKDIIRNRPTVTIPDDHDVGQGNLWGGGGGKVKIDTQGGYTRPAEYVKMVERQQTSHLPDPWSKKPLKQGITSYYTSLLWGEIDFAIVEDRKFKSGCYDFDIVKKKLGPRPDHIAKPNYNPQDFDVPGKKLLGDGQIRFLNTWATQWQGVKMKSLVSQTIFSMASTYHSKGKTFYYADFDAGGWPQRGRNKAIDAMRRCFAFHICGDQHLATIVQYGIDDWRDANYAFCVPSIANLWPRWWIPKGQKPRRTIPGGQEHTGDYLDGFGNKLTVFAHTNPMKTGREPAALHDRMPGFGVIEFNKKTRRITMNCWPRMVDPTDPQSKQYPGWPRTVHQYDNFGKASAAVLPVIRAKANDPVVQIINEKTGKIVYTLRILGKVYQPKVFDRSASYTVKVTSGKDTRIQKGVKPLAPMPDKKPQ